MSQITTCFLKVAAVIASATLAAMKTTLQTQLDMVRTCVDLAQRSDHKPVWSGQIPTAFGKLLARVESEYGALTAKAVLAEAAKVGAADAKAVAETELEESAFVLARALVVHLRQTGDLQRRAVVDFSKSEIVRVRKQELVHRATGIRDIGASVVAESGAEELGITTQRVDSLSRAIVAFTEIMNAPRGNVVSRGTLLREIETDVAALLHVLDDLDGLVLQFRSTAAGRRFYEAWRRARIIVDVGGGGSDERPQSPTAPTAPSAEVQPAPRPSPVAAPAAGR